MVQKNLGVTLEVGTVLSSSVSQLAEIIASNVGVGAATPTGATSTGATDGMDIEGSGTGEETPKGEEEYDQDDEHAPFPLLPMQRIYAIGRLLTTEGSNNAWISWSSEVAAFDRHKFEWAMTVLVRRHPMLRAIILADGSTQKILPPDENGWSLEVENPATNVAFKEAQDHIISKVHEFGAGLASSLLFDIYAVDKTAVGEPGTVQVSCDTRE